MDIFSKVSGSYQKYRPSYPTILISDIVKYLKSKSPLTNELINSSWDVATGTGQTARLLSPYFKKVFASDGSLDQIRIAKDSSPNPNIVFFVHQTPNNIDLENNALIKDNILSHNSNINPSNDLQFDLITCSQAFHWFYPHYKQTLDLFTRYLKPNGIVAIIAYKRPEFKDPDLDILFYELYKKSLGPYWRPNYTRPLIETEYKELDFSPLNEVFRNRYSMDLKWTWDEFEGYIKTWSSYVISKEEGSNVADVKLDEIKSLYGNLQELVVPSFVIGFQKPDPKEKK